MKKKLEDFGREDLKKLYEKNNNLKMILDSIEIFKDILVKKII